jgi:GntR family transcriptional regulator
MTISTLFLGKQPMYKIDRNSKLPLYELIEQDFRQMITSGELKTGQLVPAEGELCELYQVSRLTVRRAMDELARQGWILRRQGVGTFIENPMNTQIAPSRLSFTEQMKAVGRTPSSKVLGLKETPATAEVAHRLGLHEGDAVIELSRLRLADGEPILFETTYLSAARFPGLADSPDFASGSLYEYLATAYGVTVAVMNQTLEPFLITEREAEILGIQAGTPSIFSEVLALDAEERPIEYTWSISSGNKSKFYFTFQRKDASR